MSKLLRHPMAMQTDNILSINWNACKLMIVLCYFYKLQWQNIQLKYEKLKSSLCILLG